MLSESELRLAEALGDDVHSRLTASMIMGVRSTLTLLNVRRLLAGETAAEVYPTAVTEAVEAFDLLRSDIR
ncbi:hypothetical protein KZZ52_59975 [Dactylosporangium sp. AC04546]|uniref:hypothetical protein n=1 Tax=Dactylosporangium sp. AC04546 TaxID=2862460 RepID=UPI001EDEFDBE|nr:hypothetical protein [Dactylosporangium sp. AC04546]WVK83855.1 hypothetical protein KZZ52_59975 [Dactylosporangium sp. AC04546]